MPGVDPDRQRQGVHGTFNQPPVEVLFDRICRENGITHRLTQPRSPTTTRNIEPFHRSLRALVPHRPSVLRVCKQLRPSSMRPSSTTTSGGRIKRSGWPPRPNRSSRLRQRQSPNCAPYPTSPRPREYPTTVHVARRASKLGVVCVHWQQVCLRVAAAVQNIDVSVTDQVMQFFYSDQLLRTEQRQHPGEIRRAGIHPRTTKLCTTKCHRSTEHDPTPINQPHRSPSDRAPSTRPSSCASALAAGTPTAAMTNVERAIGPPPESWRAADC